MKCVILLLALVVNASAYSQLFNDGFSGMSFPNERLMFEYAFQNSDLTGSTSGLFLDYQENPDSVLMVLQAIRGSSISESEHLFQIASIMDRIDLTGNFQNDSLVFPQFDRIYSLDGERNYRLPVFVFDTKLSRTNAQARNIIETWNSVSPFPAFSQSDLIDENYFYAALLFDTLSYQNCSIYFDPETIRSNRSRQLTEIHISDGSNTVVLTPGMELDITNWAGNYQIVLDFVFDDGSTEQITQQFSKTTVSAQAKDAFFDFADSENITHFRLNPSEDITIHNPEIQVAVKYGCVEGKIQKPYIIVTGWTPYTDIGKINTTFGFPATIHDFATNIESSLAGFLSDLNAKSFDIIIMKPNPPVASVLHNAELVERALNWVNDQKMANGSYEENIVQGISAGALAVKLALLKMENAHLNASGPHPHVKLFISDEGENQGANIPLALQHHAVFLDQYAHSNNTVWFGNPTMSPGAVMYILRYAIDAPLSKELLRYHHSQTGASYLGFYGQGAHPLRSAFLSELSANNHSLNAHIPDYPSFQRNISISNGSSTPNYNFSDFSVTHYPYPSETGAQYFYLLGAKFKVEARFLTHGTGTPFIFGYKPLWSTNWQIAYEAVTKDPLVLDNAPGGIMVIENNFLQAANDVSGFQLPICGYGFPDVVKDHLFSFTSPVFTHDIRNYNSFAEGHFGYMNYNFKERFLNFDNEVDAATQNPLFASNTIGYPHLSYPPDHYEITPFDALYTWDENTVHITCGRKSQSYYEEEPSPMQPDVKNFFAEESEYWNIFNQNKRIGYYARPGYTYRADFIAENDIYWGDHVTQKTDFKPVVIESNAVVRAWACDAHIFQATSPTEPGVHIKPGADAHFMIDCIQCNHGKQASQSSDPRFRYHQDEDPEYASQLHPAEEAHGIRLIPNPAEDQLVIHVTAEAENASFDYYIYDLSGNLVQQGRGRPAEAIALNLTKGMYILRIKTTNQWYSEKLLIH